MSFAGAFFQQRLVRSSRTADVNTAFSSAQFAWKRCPTTTTSSTTTAVTFTTRNNRGSLHSWWSGVLQAASSEDESSFQKSPDDESDSSKTAAPTPPSSSTGSSSRLPLDPLFVAVTRMDEETASAPTASVPIWGELILDRSLFVFLPLLGFGLGGILLSLYIIINSGDALVDAVAENAVWQSSGGSITTTVDSPSCRGLCSSQEQDLQGLREYMSRFAKSPPVSLE